MIMIVAPMISVLPFVFEIVKDEPSENMWITSSWHVLNSNLIGGVTLLFPYGVDLSLFCRFIHEHALHIQTRTCTKPNRYMREFSKIPYGFHNVLFAYVSCYFYAFMTSTHDEYEHKKYIKYTDPFSSSSERSYP